MSDPLQTSLPGVVQETELHYMPYSPPNMVSHGGNAIAIPCTSSPQGTATAPQEDWHSVIQPSPHESYPKGVALMLPSMATLTSPPPGTIAGNLRDDELFNYADCDGCGLTIWETVDTDLWKPEALWRISKGTEGGLFYQIHSKPSCYSSLVSKLGSESSPNVYLICPGQPGQRCNRVTYMDECFYPRAYEPKSTGTRKCKTTTLALDAQILCGYCSITSGTRKFTVVKVYLNAGKQERHHVGRQTPYTLSRLKTVEQSMFACDPTSTANSQITWTRARGSERTMINFRTTIRILRSGRVRQAHKFPPADASCSACHELLQIPRKANNIETISTFATLATLTTSQQYFQLIHAQKSCWETVFRKQ